MILIKQICVWIITTITTFFIDLFIWFRDLHICTGEWVEKECTEHGGGYCGFKKCYREYTKYTKTCTICGKVKTRREYKTDWIFYG